MLYRKEMQIWCSKLLFGSSYVTYAQQYEQVTKAFEHAIRMKLVSTASMQQLLAELVAPSSSTYGISSHYDIVRVHMSTQQEDTAQSAAASQAQQQQQGRAYPLAKAEPNCKVALHSATLFSCSCCSIVVVAILVTDKAAVFSDRPVFSCYVKQGISAS